MSLMASAKLHGLHPEAYLQDIVGVLAHWPRDRYLELAPLYWKATCAKLDPAQLATEIGPVTMSPADPPVEKRPAD